MKLFILILHEEFAHKLGPKLGPKILSIELPPRIPGEIVALNTGAMLMSGFSTDFINLPQSFDEFLLMFSVFSEKAPREMKVHYAFKIYGKRRSGFSS